MQLICWESMTGLGCPNQNRVVQINRNRHCRKGYFSFPPNEALVKFDLMFKFYFFQILITGIGLLLGLNSSAQLNPDSIAPVLKKTEQWLILRKDSLSPSSLLLLQQLYTKTGYRIQGLDPCALLQKTKSVGIIRARSAAEGCTMVGTAEKSKQAVSPIEKLSATVYLYPSAFSQNEFESAVQPLLSQLEGPWVELMYLFRFAVKKEVVRDFSYRYDSLIVLLNNRVVNSIENPKNTLQRRLEIYAAALQTGVLNHVHWRWIKNLRQWQLSDGSFASGGRLQLSSEQSTIGAFLILTYAYTERIEPADKYGKRKSR